MTIRININYEISIPDCNIETIIACFKKILLLFLADFVISILTEFAQFYMNQERQPFECEKCGSNNKFIWKTKNAKDTRIGKIFGSIKVGQMQVECKGCGKKVYITRKLLDIAPRKLMSDGTKKVFGLLGSLTSFRVSETILKMVGVKMDKMSVWRCTQDVGEKLEFGLDVNRKARGESSYVPGWIVIGGVAGACQPP